MNIAGKLQNKCRKMLNIVITSYSIHYTKLYDLHHGPRHRQGEQGHHRAAQQQQDQVLHLHLTQEMVRSTMVQTKTSFTGISPVSGSRDDYQAAYQSWRTVNFITTEWNYVPLNKDPEVFPSEGYLIKTRGTTAVDTEVV